jgi:hypothetical protein
MLLGCVDSTPTWRSWTCKQVLVHAALKPDAVLRLNAEAGALYPLALSSPAEAEEMLTLFLKRGVDINARSQKTDHQWTALHAVAAAGSPEQARLLIKHGARTDVRDSNGMTPIDVARSIQSKYPQQQKATDMLRILESAGQSGQIPS